MAGKRIAVVGATGNVGTSVVRTLSDDDRVASVLGIARRGPSWTFPKLHMTGIDVTSDNLEDVFAGCDAVIALSWIMQPTRDPVKTWRTNVLGSKRVFAAAARSGVPALIYGSSIGAYSPRTSDDPVDENWPTDGWPGAAYTREKAYVERLLDNFAHHNPAMRVVRLRPGFIFKREAATHQRRLLAGPLFPSRMAKPGGVPVMPIVPGVRFQITHTDDVAQAYREAAMSEVTGAFNLAAEPPVDTELLAELLGARPVRMSASAVRAMLAAAWTMRAVPMPPGMFDALCRMPIMDTSRARTELNWSPRYTARETMLEFLSGLVGNAGLATPPRAAGTPGGRVSEFTSGLTGRE